LLVSAVTGHHGSKEVTVAQGLILLGFLAVLAAYFTVRTRRRIGLGSTGRHWVLVITGFVIVVLVLWAVSTR
jgi:hypothetical protein